MCRSRTNNPNNQTGSVASLLDVGALRKTGAAKPLNTVSDQSLNTEQKVSKKKITANTKVVSQKKLKNKNLMIPSATTDLNIPN